MQYILKKIIKKIPIKLNLLEFAAILHLFSVENYINPPEWL